MIMSSADQAADEYKVTLDELVNNNKTQINLLTILAEDYQNYADAIVEVIKKQILSVPKERKLPIMYVADSIMKNVENKIYKDLFGGIIVDIFLAVFKAGDEKMRQSLHKLRQTWVEIFNPSKLYMLDMKIHEVDAAWPVQAPRKPGSRTAAPSNNRTVVSSSSIHVNPHFKPHPSTAVVNSKPDPRVRRGQENKPAPEIKKEIKRDPLDELLGPSTSVPEPRRHSPMAPKRKAERPADEDLRKRRSTMDVDHRDPRSRVPAPSVSIQPTNALGSHAFVSAPRPVPPAIGALPNGSFHPKLPPSGFPLPNNMHSNAPPIFPMPGMGGPPPSVAPAPARPPPVITTDTVKLEGIPANNRIFVDGKAHEVLYIGETAVIERNGLPHRIYFTGIPRNVIIDGIPHLLAFGEKKVVVIDGAEHVLRFGAPSKELYMGDFPFKGAFGGPPIFATINGVRHEIRLCGPAPEVKIEPDPSYDLARFMTQVRGGAPAAPEPPKKPNPPPVDALSLLKKLQMSGFLGKKDNQSASGAGPSGSAPANGREATPPIPSEHRMEKVERKPTPSASLKDFNMRLLKIRYDSVISSLHEKRNACPHCGLRMAELRGEKYQQHLDWHVKKNLRALDNKSRNRQWYTPAKDWLKSEEEMENEKAAAARLSEEREIAPAVESEEVDSKECAVCQERFDEYFDEDADVWKLKDCVVVGKKTYHSGCVNDASMMDESTMSVKEEPRVKEEILSI